MKKSLLIIAALVLPMTALADQNTIWGENLGKRLFMMEACDRDTDAMEDKAEEFVDAVKDKYGSDAADAVEASIKSSKERNEKAAEEMKKSPYYKEEPCNNEKGEEGDKGDILQTDTMIERMKK
jgi:hypothetical protein